jgi:hypothetical protein
MNREKYFVTMMDNEKYYQIENLAYSFANLYCINAKK